MIINALTYKNIQLHSYFGGELLLHFGGEHHWDLWLIS